jgi:hypothetical protein
MLLKPHVEPFENNISIAQIYITRAHEPFLGTTIYCGNDILVQLPYRDNFGWCFLKSHKIMHGKLMETPDDVDRCSIMLRFD